MNSLGWSRREPEPVNTAPPSLLGRLQNLNPFGEGGYVRLPINETNPGAPLPAPTRREEEEGWFARKYCSRYCGRAACVLLCASRTVCATLPPSCADRDLFSIYILKCLYES
jgi:hypothetical protein